MKALHTLILFFSYSTLSIAGNSLTIPINFIDESVVGAKAGQVLVTESEYGLVFTPNLAGLKSGLYGFHVHENPSCNALEKDGQKVAGLAAGGHLDPQKTAKHDYPWGNGHLGDLPPLFVNADGIANQPVLAPRLKLADLSKKSLMIHAGGDNHSDHPKPLGGGGKRMLCGVIE